MPTIAVVEQSLYKHGHCRCLQPCLFSGKTVREEDSIRPGIRSIKRGMLCVCQPDQQDSTSIRAPAGHSKTVSKIVKCLQGTVVT